MLENENKSSNNKRKKKRSANQMAKKFARSHSHGYDLDSETYQYMVRVLELSKQDFPSDEERCNFANNVYEQTVGHEVSSNNIINVVQQFKFSQSFFTFSTGGICQESSGLSRTRQSHEIRQS